MHWLFFLVFVFYESGTIVITVAMLRNDTKPMYAQN